MSGKYKVIFGDNPDQLRDRVNIEISSSVVIPQGGICMSENTLIFKNSNNENLYGQFFQSILSGAYDGIAITESGTFDIASSSYPYRYIFAEKFVATNPIFAEAYLPQYNAGYIVTTTGVDSPTVVSGTWQYDKACPVCFEFTPSPLKFKYIGPCLQYFRVEGRLDIGSVSPPVTRIGGYVFKNNQPINKSEFHSHSTTTIESETNSPLCFIPLISGDTITLGVANEDATTNLKIYEGWIGISAIN